MKQSGHEMVMARSRFGIDYTLVCHEPVGAACRLTCSQGCEEWSDVAADGSYHDIEENDVEEDGGTVTNRHDMEDGGECLAVASIEGSDIGEVTIQEEFELARFPVRVEWDGDGYNWQPSR